MRRDNWPRLLGLILLVGAVAPVAAGTVTGVVFVDANGNGTREAGEAGLPGVLVSDGAQVLPTDAAGSYALPLPAEGALVRLSIPTGYWPAAMRWFERVAPAETATCDFPLQAQAQTSPWTMVQVTDVHFILPAAAKVAAWCAQVNALQPAPVLVMATGDLVMESNAVSDPTIIRRLFSDYATAVAPLHAPRFDLPGNHDHPGVKGTLPPGDPLYGVRGFETLLGPAWYSLNYAGVHLLTLDGSTITLGNVGNGVAPECLAWLRADLAATPAGTPLLVFVHQPPGQWGNKADVQAVLAGRTVLGIFTGHTHASPEYAWAGFHVHEGGALCGGWWTGPCPDGKPRGFRLLQVTPQSVQTQYVVAAEPPPAP